MGKDLRTALEHLGAKLGLDLSTVRRQIEEEQRKPLTAAVFGQTGCGKSSLTNAVFGTAFEVDDVRPCTKEPQVHHGVDGQGNKIEFWDLPGIGESEAADRRYLDMYREFAASCDVVLWAFPADTRSMTLDAAALDGIVAGLADDKKTEFLSRLAIVVTKADLISPAPWCSPRTAPMCL